MKCQCGHGTVVKDGRYIESGYWRRRKCLHCGTEYTTVEQFCTTVKGHGGTQKKEAAIQVPPSPTVRRVKPRQSSSKPVTPKQRTHTVVNARLRVEALREQRELEKL